MRIVIADDQRNVRAGLRILLEQEAGLDIIGEAEELNSLVSMVEKLMPEMVLLDWELPNQKLTDIVSTLHRFCPDIKVIALSGRPEAYKAAADAGVDAFVSKGDYPEKILEAIRGMF